MAANKQEKEKEKEKEKELCPVCCDTYTSVIRTKVSCFGCGKGACRGCQQKYLLSTLADPHCMHCRKEFNRDFIDTFLTKSFRMHELRKHRRTALLDREKGKLPAMQVFLEARREYNREMAEYNRIHRQRNLVLNKKVNLKREIAELEKDAEKNATKIAEKRAELQETRQMSRNLLDMMNTHWAAGQVQQRIWTGVEAPERKEFKMKCPGEDCRGFLSQAWKCGVCEKFFCSDCHAEKAELRDGSHVCKEDDKATAALIKKDTKPCPKCGARISKINGCDMMWCTVCKDTTFSWNTGQILTGVVNHNPHYYEYMRTAGRVLPRENGDIPCGGIPDYYVFSSWIRNNVSLFMVIDNLTRDELYQIHRCLQDMQWAMLPQYPLRRQENDTRDLDIEYMMGSMNEDEWATELEHLETNFERKREIGQILQTFVQVGAERMAAAVNSPVTPRSVPEFIEEMKKLRQFTNEALFKKAVQMNILTPQITDKWERTTLQRNKSQILGLADSEQKHKERREKIQKKAQERREARQAQAPPNGGAGAR
jgi:hypothetical protein